VAFWNRATDLIDTAAAMADVPPSPRVAGSLVPTYSEFQAMRGLWSMQVPAFRRGVSLISGTIAQCPVRQYGDGARIPTQYESGAVPWVTMQRTVRDGILHGRAYWRIVAVGTVTVYKHEPADSVTENPDGTLIMGDATERQRSDMNSAPIVGRVVVFTFYDEGALIAGVDALATAYALEVASRNYAESPHPGDVLQNVSAHELSDDEIAKARHDWAAARRDPDGAVAYLNAGFALGDAKGWSPTELALADQRNQSALQMARLLNLDGLWLGAGAPSSSLSYVNRVDLRQDLVDLTLTDYMLPIEQRMSAADMYRGECRFDTSAFLRSNLPERATVAIGLVGAGIVTAQEGKAFVSESTTGGPA
jgi:hypothetical protein